MNWSRTVQSVPFLTRPFPYVNLARAWSRKGGSPLHQRNNFFFDVKNKKFETASELVFRRLPLRLRKCSHRLTPHRKAT